MTEHVADRAALYALGALNEEELAALLAHVRGCPECARALGEAERDVDLLASLQTQHAAPAALTTRISHALAPVVRPAAAPRYAWPQFAALAAAFVIGLLPSLYFWQQNRAMDEVAASQSAAIDRLASAPHVRAPFQPVGGTMRADVMYARDGSWYVVLARGVSHALDVAWMHDGTKTMLGKAMPRDGVAMLYLPQSHPMNQLALMDGERIVAEVKLPF